MWPPWWRQWKWSVSSISDGGGGGGWSLHTIKFPTLSCCVSSIPKALYLLSWEESLPLLKQDLPPQSWAVQFSSLRTLYKQHLFARRPSVSCVHLVIVMKTTLYTIIVASLFFLWTLKYCGVRASEKPNKGLLSSKSDSPLVLLKLKFNCTSSAPVKIVVVVVMVVVVMVVVVCVCVMCLVCLVGFSCFVFTCSSGWYLKKNIYIYLFCVCLWVYMPWYIYGDPISDNWSIIFIFAVWGDDLRAVV